MLRPGQQEHGSYGLVFNRHRNLLCDELLICYPSQLSRNNTLNGTIPSIPYRTKAKRNEVTQKCEEHRKNFCSQAKNKAKCSVGQPGSSIWHGIMLKAEYNEKEIITKISLSITNTIYQFFDLTHFNFEFGQKEDIITRIFTMAYKDIKDKRKYVKLNETIIPSEEKLKNEFLSNVNNGAYLYKYAGLWSLGLDLLPSDAQGSLNLFFYRGCVCEVEVWFKKPTTPSSASPKTPNRPIDEMQFNDEICKLFTDNEKLPLGNINEKEKLVELKLRTGNVGEYGKIVLLFDDGNVVLKIDFDKNWIIFRAFGKYNIYETNFKNNLLAIGAKIEVKMRLNKYFALTYVKVNDLHPLHYKLFPPFWWEGKLFAKSNNSQLLVHGDFVSVSPVRIRAFQERHLYRFANKMGQVVQMPFSLKLDEVISNTNIFRFRCMLKKDAKWFYIKLRKDIADENYYCNSILILRINYLIIAVGKTIYGLEVNFKNNRSRIYTESLYEHLEPPTRWIDNKVFEKGIPFECEISVKKYIWADWTNTIINIVVNGIKLEENEIESEFSIWMVNLISIGGDIQLLDFYRYDLDIPEMPERNYKKKLDMKLSGKIVCFEGRVPSVRDMLWSKSFQVNLFYGGSEYYFNTVNVLTIDFVFDVTFKLRKSNIEPSRAFLYVRGYKGLQEMYRNPIGRNGVPIVLLIFADEKENLFRIIITGNIYNVVFDDGPRCQNLREKFPKHTLPTNIKKLERNIEVGNKIIIKGRIPVGFNKSITVNFLHKAIKGHRRVGVNVFQLEVQRNISCVNSYTPKDEWIHGLPGLCKNHTNLEDGQRIRLSIYPITFNTMKSDIETEENLVEMFYNMSIPLSAIEYIEIRGFDPKENVTFVRL